MELNPRILLNQIFPPDKTNLQEEYRSIIKGLMDSGYTVVGTPDLTLTPDYVNPIIEARGHGVRVAYSKRENYQSGHPRYRMFPYWAFWEQRSLETVLTDKADIVAVLNTRDRLGTELKRQKPFPFEVFLDGEPQRPDELVYTDQSELTVKILPEFHQVPEFQQFFNLQLTLFKNTIRYLFRDISREPSKRELSRMNGKNINMGHFPHLMAHSQTYLQIPLTAGEVYDVLVMDRRADGGRDLAFYHRLTRHEKKLSFFPTPEEMRYLAIEDLGLTPKEAKGVYARVGIMGGFMQRVRQVPPLDHTGIPVIDDHYTSGPVFDYLTPEGSEAGFYSHVSDNLSTWHSTKLSLEEIRHLIDR